MSFKKDLSYFDGLEIAKEFLSKTADLYSKAEIAGSLRRREAIVHDVDFAVLPFTTDFAAWGIALKNRVAQIGGTIITIGEVICNLRFKDSQVNLFVCTDDKTWGVVLMWATGPKGHTIGMTIKAEKLGLKYTSKGIFTREEPPKLVPALSELEVAKILRWKFKPPETRGKEAVEKSGGMFY